jgi:hypothetical protein
MLSCDISTMQLFGKRLVFKQLGKKHELVFLSITHQFYITSETHSIYVHVYMYVYNSICYFGTTDMNFKNTETVR